MSQHTTTPSTPSTAQADHAKDRTATTGARSVDHHSTRRISTETKASPKTSELYAYIAAVVGVLIASALVDRSDFGAQEAWFYVTLLTIGYMVSRGLAKSGSRDYFDDDR